MHLTGPHISLYSQPHLTLGLWSNTVTDFCPSWDVLVAKSQAQLMEC